MNAFNTTAPLVCPRCKGSGRDTQEIDCTGRRGEALYLPCMCIACSGKGFISVGYYRKLCRAAKLANRALAELRHA